MVLETHADYLAGYRVVRKLGEGQRSVVYLGRADTDDPAEHPVAIKVFRADVADSDIMAELDVLARVPAAHCVHLLDASSGPDGRPIVVMSRAARGSVGRLVHRRGGLSAGESVTIIAPIAGAVAELHRAGIAHTRISASTIHFTEDGSPQLLGFGHTEFLPAEASPAVVEADPGASRDRRALAQLVRLLLEPEGDAPDVGAVTRGASDLLRWLDETAVVNSAGFSSELEERIFDLCEAVPVDLDRETVPGATRVLAPRTPARVDGSVSGGRVSRSDGRPPARGDALVEQLLGAAPFAALGQRFVRSLRAVRARWWVTLAVVVLGLIAFLTLGPDVTLTPAPATPRAAETLSDGAAIGRGTVPSVEAWPDDPVEALPGLLAERARCRATEPVLCLDNVDQQGSTIYAVDSAWVSLRQAGGAMPSAAQEAVGNIQLVAQLGDAAVIELTVNEQPASVLMIRTEAGWRLRTLFGVQEQ